MKNFFCIFLLCVALLLSNFYANAVVPKYISPISVLDYGAIANDGQDDTDAILKAAATAKRESRSLYLPAGTYNHTKMRIDGIQVYGDGDETILHSDDAMNKSITFTGNNVHVRDLKTTTNPTVRRGGKGALKFIDATNFSIINVTIDGANGVGCMIKNCKNGYITANRVSNTKADGIHNTSCTYNVVISNNTLENIGDDFIAVVSYRYLAREERAGYGPKLVIEDGKPKIKDETQCSEILIEGNKASNGYHARGISVVGGSNVTIRNNHVSNTRAAGYYIFSESSYQTYDVNNILVENNVAENTAKEIHVPLLVGSMYKEDKYPNSYVRNVLFKNNKVLNSSKKNIGRVISPYTENICSFDNTLEGETHSFQKTKAEDTPTITGYSLNAPLQLPPIVSFIKPTFVVIKEGTAFDVKIEAKDYDGKVSYVTLYLDDVLVSEISTIPYQWSSKKGNDVLKEISLGEHHLTALAVDNDGKETVNEMMITVTEK